MSLDRRKWCVLLVEDQPELARLLGGLLEKELFDVDYALDGPSSLHLAEANRYGVLLLDLSRPGTDAVLVSKALRARGGHTSQILMLSCRDSLEDKLRGFAAGVVDYLVKPFGIDELIARIRALVRRGRRELSPEVLRLGDLVLDTGTLRVARGGELLSIRALPLRLLWVSIRHSPHCCFTRSA